MIDGCLNQLTLLYVEDDISIRDVLSRRLERSVKRLYVASDGQEGYEKFLEFKPDIVLTDVTMPRMNGIEMSKKIKEINEHVPIIVVSAHGEAKYLLEAIECGISNYLLKPIEKVKLYTMLEKQAKSICLDKENEKKNKMLQNIINVQKNICFVTDFKKVLFPNKAFLDYFGLENLEGFENKFKQVLDIFEPLNGYLNKSLIKAYEEKSEKEVGNEFYELYEKTEETKRVVIIIDKTFTPRSFYLTISSIEQNVFLMTLTDITEMTVEKVDTQKKAYTDKLTGLANRNKMVEFFEAEVLRAQRYENKLSIAILDIDFFKKFNDTYGHLVGDEVLVMLAQNLQNNLRSTDMIARWGGEEFVIIFVETALDDAVNTANILRQKVETLNHPVAGKITVSFGVTQYQKEDTLDSLFERCDQALYKAKENGRNRVEEE